MMEEFSFGSNLLHQKSQPNLLFSNSMQAANGQLHLVHLLYFQI